MTARIWISATFALTGAIALLYGQPLGFIGLIAAWLALTPIFRVVEIFQRSRSSSPTDRVFQAVNTGEVASPRPPDQDPTAAQFGTTGLRHHYFDRNDAPVDPHDLGF